MKKKISIVGLGYIGLPTALLFASNGYFVNAYDKDEEKIKKLSKKIAPFKEKSLNKYFAKSLKKKNINFSNNLVESDIYIICVPTPLTNNKKPNMNYVNKATQEITKYLKDNDLIILESTSPVGTTNKINDYISVNRPNIKNIKIAYCPERVLPGNIFFELINNKRIIGGINKKSSLAASALYNKICRGKIVLTSSNSAEFVKLLENTYRDINIALSNEISMLSYEMNINVYDVIKMANLHPRVNIMNPGPGVGGHCIPVDPWFLCDENFKNNKIIKLSRKINSNKTYWVKEQINRHINNFKKNNKKNPQIGILGITYKPDCDDLRESPSLEILRSIKHKKLFYHDPFHKKIKKFNYLNFNKIIKLSDILIILVKNKFYIKNKRFILKNKIKVLDFCNFYEN